MSIYFLEQEKASEENPDPDDNDADGIGDDGMDDK